MSAATAIPFSNLRDAGDLAKYLGCQVADLNAFIDFSQSRFYTELKIPKKGRARRGQFRTVYRPVQDLGLLQKIIATSVMSKSSFPDCVQGFVPHRSIVTNARIHLGQKVLLHADIHNFFDSITVSQVFETFENLGCAPVVADLLAKLCTLDGFLPQGSSASPVLANLVSRYLDADLCSLAVAHNCKYSRYGDDITISGDSIPQAAQIERILKKHGFELRDGKCRTQRRGGSQYVTGLSVFEKSGPRIPTLFKRRLRLELHYASLFGWKSHVAFIGAEDSERYEAARIEGWIRFIHSVEPQAAAEFDAEWQKILAKREEDDEQFC